MQDIYEIKMEKRLAVPASRVEVGRVAPALFIPTLRLAD
jgi:hypothetical protein